MQNLLPKFIFQYNHFSKGWEGNVALKLLDVSKFNVSKQQILYNSETLFGTLNNESLCP